MWINDTRLEENQIGIASIWEWALLCDSQGESIYKYKQDQFIQTHISRFFIVSCAPIQCNVVTSSCSFPLCLNSFMQALQIWKVACQNVCVCVCVCVCDFSINFLFSRKTHRGISAQVLMLPNSIPRPLPMVHLCCFKWHLTMMK